jgi:hypothetical protein
MVKIVVNNQEIETEPYESTSLDLNKIKCMEWINVKDALPIDTQEVLYVMTCGPKKKIREIMKGYREKKGWVMCCRLDQFPPLPQDGIDVTHWMPLPDLPEDE